MSLAASKRMIPNSSALLLLVLCLTPSNARAHALLVDSVPKNNAVLAQAPREAILQFNSRIEKNVSQVALLAPDGHKTALTKQSNEAQGVNRLVLALPRLKPGAYRIEYRVLASDGHRTPGIIHFNVSDDTAGAKTK